MASLNRVQLIGRLTRDPELKITPSGYTLTTFTLATDRRGKDKDADFHSIVVFDRGTYKLASLCAEYLGKGRLVYVEGTIQNRNWEGDDGQKRYSTEIIADSVVFLERKPEASGGYDANVGEIDPDEIPF